MTQPGQTISQHKFASCEPVLTMVPSRFAEEVLLLNANSLLW